MLVKFWVENNVSLKSQVYLNQKVLDPFNYLFEAEFLCF